MGTQAEAPSTELLSSNRTAVALTGVGRVFPARKRDDVVALDGVDLRVETGEVVAVVGPSGCGKSTLLELVAGLQEPDAGAVSVVALSAEPTADASQALASRRAACAYMPQRDLLLPWRDALGNAALALECQGVARAEARRQAAPLFERFGLAEFERSRPAALSGGMRQRVAFLRTLLPGRPVLLLDEPFGALDSITRGAMQEWLAEALVHEPRTVLLVTHDVQEALLLADRVVILSPRPGRVVAELTVALPRPRLRRELVADPAFGRLEQAALEALERGSEQAPAPEHARGEATQTPPAAHSCGPEVSS
jgi:ABC-type nitrate/sulfonate/bicarbonate transport system ATPase subunit